MAEIGHNSEGIGDNSVAADEIRSLIERIERLEEDRKEIGKDIKDVMGEAKSRGYDAKTIRKVLAIRKMKPEEYTEQQALIDVYLQALGVL